MGYHAKKIEFPEAANIFRSFDYALVYGISNVILERSSQLEEIDWEECQEARFFSENRELHIFEAEDGKRAVLVEDKDEENQRMRKYQLSGRFSKFGKVLKVIEYLSYDDDGQMRVALTRLAGIE